MAPKKVVLSDSESDGEQNNNVNKPSAAASRAENIRKKPKSGELEQHEEELDRAEIERTEGYVPKNGRRVVIEKMKFVNFKSYAGTQEVGPFHKNFSAVVGPNGSGKSNVIDGLLFVSGKRAKSLRQGKVSELIHSSAEHPNLDYAEVAIFFVEIQEIEGTEEFTIIEGTQFNVSRSAYRNNTSKYHINGKPAGFTEVGKILKTKGGIDLTHNRFLILQGEVEQIAMMKPKGTGPGDEGLLEYLEDIIGSYRFVGAIEDAGKVLETLNEERAEKVNRVRFVEKEKDALEKSKIEAESYIAQEVELCKLQGQYAQVQVANLRKSGGDLRAKKENIENQLAEEKSKVSKYDSEVKALENQLEAAQIECETVSKAMEKSKGEFQIFERKDIKLKEDMKHLKQKEKKALDNQAKEEKKRAEAQHAAKSATEDIAKAESAMSGITTKLAQEEKKLQDIFESLKKETGPLREALEKKQTELVPRAKVVAELQSQVDVAAAERDIVRSQLNAGQNGLAEAETAHKECVEAITASSADFKRVVKEQADNEALLTKSQQQLTEALPREEQLVKAQREWRARLEVAKSSVTDDMSRNKIVTSLLKARDSKQLTGVYGRLGDLATIDPMFDVAISTACPSLNNIVVETAADGQKCVEYLRRNNLGRATFIILEKIEYLRKAAAGQIETPEAAQRLFELINIKDAKFQTAFYFALRDTLVADNLENATRLSFNNGGKRFRVVTLAGEVVDTSGTMAGGGSTVVKGLMPFSFAVKQGKDSSSSSSAANAGVESPEAVEKELVRATETLARVRAEIETLKTTISQCSAKKAEFETVVSKLQMQMKSLAMQEPELASRVEQMRKQPKKDNAAEQAKLKEIEKTIAGFEKELEKARGAASGLETEIAELQAKIMDAGGVRLRAQKAQVESYKAEVDSSSTGITKWRVQISSAEATIEKANKAIERAEAELEEIRGEMAKVKTEMTKLTEEAGSVMTAFKSAQDLFENRQEQVQEIAANLEKLKKNSLKMRSKEVDLANQLEDVLKVFNDLEKKIKYQEAMFEDARKRIVNAVSVEGEQMLTNDGAAPVIPALTDDQISALSADALHAAITQAEVALSKMESNVSAIIEYRRREKEYEERMKDLDEITARRDAQRRTHEGLRKERLDCFLKGFFEISLKLKEMYQMITLGGDAELELVDSLDPFSEGIIFSVRPPKKSWKNITNLSGGEKTLSSLSLIFSLHSYKPTPLYVMDEIDAALDFKNVSIVANYIKRKTKNAQFIIISLRNQCFELADRLVGIYKVNNATMSVTINPKKFVHTSSSSSAAAASSSSSAAIKDENTNTQKTSGRLVTA